MKVIYGQSVKDICLMVYGSINQIGQLIEDNGYKLDSLPTPGTDIIYDENLGNDVIKNFYTRKNIIPTSYTKNDGIGYMKIGSTFIIS